MSQGMDEGGRRPPLTILCGTIVSPSSIISAPTKLYTASLSLNTLPSTPPSNSSLRNSVRVMARWRRFFGTRAAGTSFPAYFS